MQFNVIFITTLLLVSAAPVRAIGIAFFSGADCSGFLISGDFPDNQCVSLGSNSGKSVGYSGVPSQIDFFVSGGGHDSCTNGPQLVLGGGSGCGTAPDG